MDYIQVTLPPTHNTLVLEMNWGIFTLTAFHSSKEAMDYCRAHPEARITMTGNAFRGAYEPEEIERRSQQIP